MEGENNKRIGGRRMSKRYALGAMTALFAIGSFVAGVFVGEIRVKPAVPAGEGQVVDRDAPPPYLLQDVDFESFWDVWQMVKERYVVQPVSDISMYYGAVSGMVASLQDPYSVFFDPATALKFAQELEGTFEGIGAEIGIKKNQLTIVAPLAGSPAERAGLLAGDKILAIDGVDTAGMAIEDAVSRIRGPKGTEVKLLVTREEPGEPKEVAIVRETIVVESVKWKTVKKDRKTVAVITISSFNESTVAKFKEAVRTVLLENPDGVILDLRNNPGGYLEAAVEVAGEWVNQDVIVIEQFSDGTKRNHPSNGIVRLASLPTVVLVNKGSASASEIVAGALQDYGKASIVGETTYGKGSVQDYVEFSDGSALKLTVALWLTPKGRTIEKNGIAPDETVEMTEEDFQEDRDPQLDRAIERVVSPPPPPPEEAAPRPESGG